MTRTFQKTPFRFEDAEGDGGTCYKILPDGRWVVEWDCRPGVRVTLGRGFLAAMVEGEED